MTIKNKIFL